jgi:cell division protein FtsI/penicillin-binding protein 2
LIGKSGSINVMDIYTGDIIAMGSSPSFDPNQFVHGIDGKEWNKINKDPMKPLINKSVSRFIFSRFNPEAFSCSVGTRKPCYCT